MDNLAQAAQAMIQGVIEVAKAEARLEEQRLGRRLTEGEAGRLATMVDRQFRLALVLAKRN